MKGLQEKDVICVHHHRKLFNWIVTVLLWIFEVFLLYGVICDSEHFIELLLIFFFYFDAVIDMILMMMNEKAILTKEKIIVYNRLGIKKEYMINEITRLVFKRPYRRGSRYIKVYAGNRKSKIRMSLRFGQDELENGLSHLLNISGYSRAGKHVYNFIEGKIVGREA